MHIPAARGLPLGVVDVPVVDRQLSLAWQIIECNNNDISYDMI